MWLLLLPPKVIAQVTVSTQRLEIDIRFLADPVGIRGKEVRLRWGSAYKKILLKKKSPQIPFIVKQFLYFVSESCTSHRISWAITLLSSWTLQPGLSRGSPHCLITVIWMSRQLFQCNIGIIQCDTWQRVWLTAASVTQARCRTTALCCLLFLFRKLRFRKGPYSPLGIPLPLSTSKLTHCLSRTGGPVSRWREVPIGIL